MTESSKDLFAIQTIGKVQETFAKEVQEWKNLLIRGGDSQSYQKYNSSFEEAIQTISEQAETLKKVLDPAKQTLVDQFLAAHSVLKSEYFAARSRFVNGTIFEPANADHAVKGKDRQVLESLKQLSIQIVETADKDREQGRSDLQRYFRAGLATSAVLTLLLLTVAFVLSDRLSKALNRITEEISISGCEVANVSHHLSTASTQVSSGASESAASIEETVASLEELSDMVKLSANHAKKAYITSCASQKTAEAGAKEMQQLSQAFSEIVSSSKKIEEIITIIDDIAFQTNLLALNAAVEAARAGEQGKGFAVVADAVRSLAQRSSVAARDIGALIKESVSQIETGNERARISDDILQKIVESVKNVSHLNQEISVAAEEQANGLEQISRAMSSLDSSTQENAATAETVSSSSQEVSQQAEILRNLVNELTCVIEGKCLKGDFHDSVGKSSNSRERFIRPAA